MSEDQSRAAAAAQVATRAKPAPRSADDRDADERTKNIKEVLDAQPKVKVRTREDEVVQIEGHTYIIKAGNSVMVPEQVAQMLEDAGRI